jgi:Ca-activated chloride channel family protein
MVVALLPLLAAWNPMERPNRAVTDGNASLQKGKAEDALAHYDQAAAALPADPAVHFNRGTALFALSRYDEAIAELMRATESKSPSLKAAAFYNLGNSYFKADRYADAIAAYKHSLGPWSPATCAPSGTSNWLCKRSRKKTRRSRSSRTRTKTSRTRRTTRRNRTTRRSRTRTRSRTRKKQEPDAGAPKQEPPKPPQGHDAGAEPPPQEEPAAQPKDDKAPEMSEIDAVLDSLERSPKDLEKMRARLRAVRRAPPAKDW